MMEAMSPIYPAMTGVSERKREILRAAALRFARKGYQATSMRSIAADVELEVSSLYSHIQGKQELLQLICTQSAEAYARGMELVLEQACEPLEQLRGVIALHIEMAMDHPASMLVHTDEWKHLEEPVSTQFLEARRAYEKQLTSIINEGVTRKQIRDISPYIIVHSLLASLTWLYQRSERLDRQSIVMQMQDLWLGGIKIG